MKRSILWAVIFFSISDLSASCGLSVCDVHQHGGEEVWLTEARASRVAYNLDDVKGSYLQTALALDYAGFPAWHLGGTASVVSNSPEEGHHKTGLGNPVLRGERSFGNWAAGALVELPLGDDEHGLAADHVAAIPYAAWRGGLGPWAADLRAGYSHSFTGGGEEHEADADGGHHAHVLVVNPHEDKELVYRAGFKRRVGKTWLGTAAEGQHALDGETEGKGFLAAGVSADIFLGGRWTAGILAEVPVVRPHRFESRWGLRVARAF